VQHSQAKLESEAYSIGLEHWLRALAYTTGLGYCPTCD